MNALILHAIKKNIVALLIKKKKRRKKVDSSFELPANFFNRDSIKNLKKKKKGKKETTVILMALFNGSTGIMALEYSIENIFNMDARIVEYI